MEGIEMKPENDSLLNTAAAAPPEKGEGKDDGNELGYLNEVQELIVRQQEDIRERLRGTEEPNVYFIYDKFTGEKLYHIQEAAGGACTCCQAQIFGGNRKFEVTVFDKFKRPIIQMTRPSACCYGGCFPFLGLCSCLDKVTVFVKNYKHISFEWKKVGLVKQNWNPIFPSFSIMDLNGNVNYRLEGPFCTSSCFTGIVFKIKDPFTRQPVGNITKEWSGLCKEITSDTDLFSIRFPTGSIDEKVKATLLASMIFVDFKYFEDSPYKSFCNCFLS